MKIVTSLAIAWGALLIVAPAYGASNAGEFAAKGAGRTSCAAFVDARTRNAPEQGQYIAFVEGYLTAANRYEPNTYDLAPWHNAGAIGAILEQHCKANAADTLAVVALKLAGAFNSIRLIEASPMIEIKEGEARAVLYAAILKRAQAELKKKGLLSIEPDGAFNPETRAALQSFQTQAKLPPTGVPDGATLWFLLNP
jgi:Putative peptidoglycan binding domain